MQTDGHFKKIRLLERSYFPKYTILIIDLILFTIGYAKWVLVILSFGYAYDFFVSNNRLYKLVDKKHSRLSLWCSFSDYYFVLNYFRFLTVELHYSANEIESKIIRKVHKDKIFFGRSSPHIRSK